MFFSRWPLFSLFLFPQVAWPSLKVPVCGESMAALTQGWRLHAKPDEDERLAELRIVLDELGLIPLRLVDGAAYVETLRGADAARQDDLDARRRSH